MQFKIVLFCVVAALVNISYGAKILGIFPMAATSHYILGNAYMRALAEAGHDVTMVSPFTEKDPPKNGSYRDVVLTGLLEEHEKMMKKMSWFGKHKQNPLAFLKFFMNLTLTSTETTITHPAVQNLLQSNEKFDVVVVEQFMNDALKAISNHFDAHLILFSTVGANAWVNPLVCNPAPPSYIPEITLGFSSHMTFFQRVKNTIFGFISTLIMQLYFLPKQAELVEKYFPNSPPLDKILYNASLILLNSHESLSSAVPLVPAMVNIGGFHVKEGKKLPKDLQDFLDNAKEGVIYFSMGSNLRSKQLPEETRDAFLKTFGKLKQKVLWKWEDDVLPGQPPNVKLSKWLPQQDVLAHPNVKLFITHGGMLSTIETVHHGVPIVAIPIVGDQKMNAKMAESGGYAKVLPFSDITEENLYTVINEVLTNPKYTEVVKKRSKFMRDRKVKPIDDAVYWTEHVIRHNGGEHLRVGGLELSWYQYLLLDVLGFILSALLIFAFVIKKIVYKVINLFLRKTKVKTN